MTPPEEAFSTGVIVALISVVIGLMVYVWLA